MIKVNKINQIIILLSFSIGFLSIMLTVYAKKIGLNAFEISLLFSVFSLINLILRPIFGFLSDRYSKKRLLLYASLIYGVAMLSYGFTYQKEILFISRIIHAVGSSIFTVTIYTLGIEISNPDNRSMIMGKIYAASSKGAFYGTFYGFMLLGFLPFFIGWKTIFISYSILAFLASIYVNRSIKESNDDVELNRPNYSIRLTKTIIILLLFILLKSAATSLITPIYIIYLQDSFTKEVSTIALALVPAALIHSYLPNKISYLIDKVGKKNGLMMGLVIAILVSYMVTIISTIEIMIILWTIEAIGLVLITVTINAIYADEIGESYIGRQSGVFMFVTMIGSIIGPVFGGAAYEFIDPHLPFYIFSIILSLNLIIILFFIPKKEKV